MKTNHYVFLIILGSSLLLFSCGKEWLDVRPEGSVDQYSLANKEGIDAILTGAYSMLDGVELSVRMGVCLFKLAVCDLSGVWKLTKEQMQAIHCLATLL